MRHPAYAPPMPKPRGPHRAAMPLPHGISGTPAPDPGVYHTTTPPFFRQAGFQALQRAEATGSGFVPPMADQSREPVVQCTVDPKQNASDKVKNWKTLTETLLTEADRQVDTYTKLRGVLTASLLTSQSEGDMGDDLALKQASLDDHLRIYVNRIKQLKTAKSALGDLHNSTNTNWIWPLDPVPVTAFGTGMGLDLDLLSGYFTEDLVGKRKMGHKVKDPPLPDELQVSSEEEVMHLLQKHAAPVLKIDYEAVAPIDVYDVQGFHENREGNLPKPKYRHATCSLIELSAGFLNIGGARVVFDVETGDVYITAHYGQNIAKRLITLAKEEHKSKQDLQEIQGLLLLKKLVSDFSLVTGIPGMLLARIEELSCMVYLKNSLAANFRTPPPQYTYIQSWCTINSHKVRKLLREREIEKIPDHEAWRAWNRYMGAEL